MESIIVVLGKYKGVEVPRPNLTVTEEELNAELNRAAKLAATNVVKDTEPAENGDQVLIDFKGFVDGIAFAGGEGSDYPLVLGSGTFIPGFEDQLIGAHKGDEVDVNVSFPANYGAPELAGKPALFKVTVKEVRSQSVPELTDEIIRKVSEQNTLEEFKEFVTGEIQKAKAENAAREQEDYIVAKIIDNSEVTVPQKMIDERAEQIRHSMENDLRNSGHTMAEYMQYNNLTQEMLEEGLQHDAKMMLEGQAVLDEIAKVEGITYTKEELDEEIRNTAKRYNMSEEKLTGMIGEHGRMALGEDIKASKAIELVLSHKIEIG